jgi:hypothetical protein
VDAEAFEGGHLTKEDQDYLKAFESIVTMGLVCGLTHPIEWAVNADRTPGGTLTDEYYEAMAKAIPRFLVESFAMLTGMYREGRVTKDDVLDWVDEHYKDNELCRGYFRTPFWESRLESAVEAYYEKRGGR